MNATSGEGVVVVLKDGNTLEVLARNDIAEPIFATPAFVDSRIYLRTEKAPYAFGASPLTVGAPSITNRYALLAAPGAYSRGCPASSLPYYSIYLANSIDLT